MTKEEVLSCCEFWRMAVFNSMMEFTLKTPLPCLPVLSLTMRGKEKFLMMLSTDLALKTIADLGKGSLFGFV